MRNEILPMARQIDTVFKEVRNELSSISSGTIIVHIRDNAVGKFGIKHHPVDMVGDTDHAVGLSEHHQFAFRQMAVKSLKRIQHWTHGQIYYDFSLKDQMLVTSVQFESCYNMSNLSSPRRRAY